MSHSNGFLTGQNSQQGSDRPRRCLRGLQPVDLGLLGAEASDRRRFFWLFRPQARRFDWASKARACLGVGELYDLMMDAPLRTVPPIADPQPPSSRPSARRERFIATLDALEFRRLGEEAGREAFQRSMAAGVPTPLIDDNGAMSFARPVTHASDRR